MKSVLIAAIAAAFGITMFASASEARGGDHRSFSHFASKSCKSSSCYAKHPSGRYTFPFHRGRRH